MFTHLRTSPVRVGSACGNHPRRRLNLVAAARCFDTAGGLASECCFATASGLTSAVATVLLFEHASEEATERTAGLRIAAGRLETTGGLTNRLVADGSSNFAATGVAGTLVMMEQFVKQARLWGAASWLDNDFAAADGLAHGLTATNGLASGVTTGVTTAEQRFHVAKGTRVGSISGEQSNGQNSRY